MYWRNSDFQVAYFLVGKCHTIDEGYRVALELLDERKRALSAASAGGAAATPEYAQALREAAFIEKIVKKLHDHPGRKHRDLPDHEAHQACQREEWKLKLAHRAKTFLLTAGTIPQDHLETMMVHPDFKDHILPAIAELETKMKKGFASLADLPEMPKLLEGPDEL